MRVLWKIITEGKVIQSGGDWLFWDNQGQPLIKWYLSKYLNVKKWNIKLSRGRIFKAKGIEHVKVWSSNEFCVQKYWKNVSVAQSSWERTMKGDIKKAEINHFKKDLGFEFYSKCQWSLKL